MKKDLIFAPALLLIGVLLFLFKMTGINTHIAISVVGVAVLIAYTVAAKKDWKNTAFEIVMRACYGIALVSGIILKIVKGIVALSVVHKISAALFLFFLVFLFVQKLIASKKA